MPIQVPCSCGKTFRVKNDRAGQRGKCPDCGRKLVVPFPVLEADGPVEPVPWSTFPEEWTGEGPLAAEAIDLGIDLRSASIRPPPAEDAADESAPEATSIEPEPVETSLPPRVDPPAPGPAYRPADARDPSPAPPAGAGIQRVVLVGIKLSFDDLFGLLFKATLAMLCVGGLIGIVVGIVAIMLWPAIVGVQR